MTTRPSSPLISCVVPAYNEAGNIEAFILALHGYLLDAGHRFEIIVINDGSKDQSQLILDRLVDEQKIACLEFSRNFGKEAALTAGIDHAKGDVVILMDSDFQHPIPVIGEFLQKWQQGFDMVYGLRKSRDEESFRKRLGSRIFYAIMSRGSSIEIPPDAGDFRLMDRKAVDALKQLPERSRFMKGLYAWVGFKSAPVYFDVEPRFSGVSHFNFKSLMRLAITGLTAFSDLPLRVWAGVGFLVSIFSLIYAAYITVRTLILGVDVPGWATLTVAILFFSGIQLISIGILGEYIARIFNEVKGRPSYVVARKLGFSENVSDNFSEKDKAE